MLWSGAVWSEVTSEWHLNLGTHSPDRVLNFKFVTNLGCKFVSVCKEVSFSYLSKENIYMLLTQVKCEIRLFMFGRINTATRVEKKNAKIFKISGEKLVFSPQILYIILRWNAVKLCKFTARVSGELTKFTIPHPFLQVYVVARIRTSHLLHVIHFFFHCAISH